VNLFLVLIVVVLIGLTVAAVMGKISGFMADPTSSQSFSGVPAEPWSAGDMARLHFDQALRGYRMNEVDEVIDALTARLGELESQVASLAVTSQGGSAKGDVMPAAGDSDEGSREPREPQE
jgi:DivIVA domain-containing protein